MKLVSIDAITNRTLAYYLLLIPIICYSQKVTMTCEKSVQFEALRGVAAVERMRIY